MSRIAYIISAYTDAPHLARLTEALNREADFYVHLDQRCDHRPFEELLAGKVTFVKSHWISWGGWQQVEYQKELLAAVVDSGVEYSRVVCLSGQDYPLWSNDRIHAYFDQHPHTEFIMGMNLSRCNHDYQKRRFIHYHFFRDLRCNNQWWKNKFIVASRHLMRYLPIRKRLTAPLGQQEVDVYFGADYWAITLPCARYVYQKLCTEQPLVRYFRTSFVPSGAYKRWCLTLPLPLRRCTTTETTPDCPHSLPCTTWCTVKPSER